MCHEFIRSKLSINEQMIELRDSVVATERDIICVELNANFMGGQRNL